MNPDSSFEQSVISEDVVSLTTVTLDGMKVWKQKLECEIKRNAFKAEKLSRRLIELWNFLGVPVIERDESLINNQNITPSLLKNVSKKCTLHFS